MASGLGPSTPEPLRVATPARVASGDRVTGWFQFDSVDGEDDAVVPGSAAVVSGAADSPDVVSSAAGASEAAGAAGTVAAGAAGSGAAGGSGAAPPGGAGCSSGPFGLSFRPSPERVAVGSTVHAESHAGLVAGAEGSGVSAAAAPAADRLTANARTAADAVAETARNAGEDGDICYLSMRAVPPLRLSGVPGSLLHPRQAPQISRKSPGSAVPARHLRQSLFSGGSATWIFRALPRPTT